MKNNKKTIVMVTAVFVVILLVAGVLLYLDYQKKQEVPAGDVGAANEQGSDELDINTIQYNGQTYKRNTAIRTMLFMGVDKKNQEMLEEQPTNGGQSDCMILFVLDTTAQTIQTIQISRDSMVNIAIYDKDGEYVKDTRAQLCLQYAYGDGEKRSCQLTKNLVSSLFYNIPINSYMSMNVEGFSVITTAMGGVDLTIPEDYTAIDASFTQGAQVNLQGSMALKYVQYRNTEELGSNNGRMERQTQFLTAMASQLKAKYGGDSDWYSSFLDVANPYMVTDMDAEMMKKLSTYSMKEEVLKVPGETVEGAKYDEYNVDTDALYQMIIDVFYNVKTETE
ncbi:MAG: LCP family protein [Hespellia sp.]|nr:LCP family protein [Hespellia sp.]